MIIQKAIALSGYCSRRKAEALVLDMEVKINGELANPGQVIDISKDEVTVKGKKIKISTDYVYIKLNKPRDYVCTSRKFVDEKNIFDLVETKYRLFTIGRLDKNSHGLIILTNNGDLTQKISHPRYEHEKIYIVKIKEDVNDPRFIINRFLKGIDIGEGDGVGKVKDIKYLQNRKFELTLTEGKKRQIRRMFENLGFKISDLLRTDISGVKLDNLKDGDWKYLSADEIKQLMK